MASIAAFKGRQTFNGRAQIDPNETETPFLTPIRPSSRHSPSLSSSPSFSSNSSLGSLSYPDDSPFSPSTPFRFSGVPFSWEHLPGIPKKISSKKKDSSTNLLPLPPAGTPIPSRKSNREEIGLIRRNYTSESFRKDPFFAALIECSKDDQDSIGNFYKSSKITRTLSDRFGLFSMYTSCKRTCPVSESIIQLPRYKPT